VVVVVVVVVVVSVAVVAVVVVVLVVVVVCVVDVLVVLVLVLVVDVVVVAGHVRAPPSTLWSKELVSTQQWSLQSALFESHHQPPANSLFFAIPGRSFGHFFTPSLSPQHDS
jgi:hypothetical protein